MQISHDMAARVPPSGLLVRDQNIAPPPGIILPNMVRPEDPGRMVVDRSRFDGYWEIICRDKRGRMKWADIIDNIVVDQGLDHLLDVGLSAGTQTATWFLGLTDGTPTVAAGDIPTSHVGWVEVTAYSEAVRQTWVDGGVAAQSVSNSAAPATFTINANGTTIGGAFLISVNTKGGTLGLFYAAGAFSAGDKLLDNLDTLDVTGTFTAAAV